jgi:hypothetical protein
MPHTVKGQELSHSVLDGGGDVIGAGEVDIATGGGQVVGLELNTHSGHYMNGATTAQNAAANAAAREAFSRLGITFPPQ